MHPAKGLILAFSLAMGKGGLDTVEFYTAKEMRAACFDAATRDEQAGAHNWLIDHNRPGCH